jgi:hypothetical protein
MTWVGGLAEWTEGDTAYLSVAFTYKLNEAYQRALWYRALGYRVVAGGPALFQVKMQHHLADVATVGGTYVDAVARHNPDATFASRGCSLDCWFCLVPKMEGTFTLIPDFPVRPVLCDNNLSGLPRDYQRHIVERYHKNAIPLLDASSGFEPLTFDDEVLAIWKPINRGPWRFAYDEQKERPQVERVFKMLRPIRPRLKRTYVLIGNEPFASCMERIREVMAWGGEPHAQAYIKLTALERRPHVRFDWTQQLLRDVARWANSPWIWHTVAFEEYRRGAPKTSRRERFDPEQGLFF